MKEQLPPIIIIGAERSGTTLLRLMFNAHPDLAIPPESLFVDELYKAFSGKELSEKDIPAIVNTMFDDLKFPDWKLDKNEVTQAIEGLDELTLANIAKVPYQLYAKREGATNWGDKNPYYSLRTDMLMELFPDAKFVHLIRDGRDNVISLLEVNWEFGPKTVAQATRRWQEYIEAAHKAAAKHPDQITEISYENLVTNPEAELKRVTEFVGLKYDPKMLEFHKENQQGDLIPDQQKKFQQSTFKPVNTSRLGRGLKQMKPADLFEFQAGAVDTLLEHDYSFVDPITKKDSNLADHYALYKTAGKVGDVEHMLETQKSFLEEQLLLINESQKELKFELERAIQAQNKYIFNELERTKNLLSDEIAAKTSISRKLKQFFSKLIPWRKRN